MGGTSTVDPGSVTERRRTGAVNDRLSGSVHGDRPIPHGAVGPADVEGAVPLEGDLRAAPPRGPALESGASPATVIGREMLFQPTRIAGINILTTILNNEGALEANVPRMIGSDGGCTIVGGGIHGTYLAGRLVECGIDRTDVTILDPRERLLDSFREKARACGMDAMRSAYVHHLGIDPFGLETFAEATGREDELVPTIDYPPRPTLELFVDYAESVIDSTGLDECHRRTTVTGIDRSRDGLVLETPEGTLDTRACVLAIGHGGGYRIPEWAEGVGGVDHVWDGFDSPTGHTVVVGGGITAGHLARELTDEGRVTLLARSPIERETAEADPPWLNWSHVERELHRYPPGSRARVEAVADARHDATMPAYLHDELMELADDGALALERGEVVAARDRGETVELALADGSRLVADRVVLATGFEPVTSHPLVDRIADGLELARGHRGTPMLDDDTLAWRDEEGETLSLYVSGALAATTVGPYAGNLPGARRAADRIVPAIDRTLASSVRTVGAGQVAAEGNDVGER